MPLLIGKNTVFYHCPKAGGSWIRDAVHNAGLHCYEILPAVRNKRNISGHSAITINNMVHLDSLRFPAPDKFCFTTIRNPLSWLISTFRHYERVGWPNNSFDNKVRSKDFNIFARRYEKECPGLVSKNFQAYMMNCDFVGKQENLVEDLIKALKLGGEEFDEKKIRDTAPVNKNTVIRKVNYNKKTRKLVIKNEYKFIKEYYPDILEV